jgi:hypothetical protein
LAGKGSAFDLLALLACLILLAFIDLVTSVLASPFNAAAGLFVYLKLLLNLTFNIGIGLLTWLTKILY